MTSVLVIDSVIESRVVIQTGQNAAGVPFAPTATNPELTVQAAIEYATTLILTSAYNVAPNAAIGLVGGNEQAVAEELQNDINELNQVFDLYSDLPSPTTIKSGTRLTVANDPVAELCGIHLAVGPVGANATHYLKN